MIQGRSLHIGLNLVDPNHYGGWDGKLNACEKDALDMEMIAKSCDHQTQLLLGKNATRQNVIQAIETAAKHLHSNDLFFLSYSGHGGQVPDFDGDEEDAIDETWCLYDGQLIDDELKYLWTKFRKGVRILVTSDSCHSGTVIKTTELENGKLINHLDPPVRCMPQEEALTTFMKNQPFYEEIARQIPKSTSEILASVLLISGCQDNQYSRDGAFNGAFTGALKRVWNGGKFNGNYVQFHYKIRQLLPDTQSPNLLSIGAINEVFLNNEKPFSVF